MTDSTTTDGAVAAPVVKETAAQRMERLKREKNPWEAFDEVRDLLARDAAAWCRSGRLRTLNGGGFIPRAMGLASPEAKAAKAKSLTTS